MNSKIIAITTGDIDGIGLEVTIKALSNFVNSKNKFLVFRSIKSDSCKFINKSNLKFLRFDKIEDAIRELNLVDSKNKIIEIVTNESPAEWVRTATNLCLLKKINGLVTGPVSKKTFIESNLGSIGHTPLIKQLCNVKYVFMGFLGKFFNVILLNGHIPLKSVEDSLDREYLLSALNIIDFWNSKYFKVSADKKPMGILGLNPHSGENGLIGSFEKNILRDIITSHSGIVGPLVPDAAFSKENWNKFSFYLALYHDQGLIPFKMIHGHSGGTHVTIGLPIIRTSVDHGTATDIFGKDIAQPESMIDAISWCENLIEMEG